MQNTEQMTEQVVADTLHEMQQIVRDRTQATKDRTGAGSVIVGLLGWQVKKALLETAPKA